jgi:biopolymer transport protein ExbD/biopolymer transport protein TolR
MGISNQSDKGSLVSEINVTPMVDVMLVLLIIFMVIAPLLQPRINVAVPKARNPDLDMRIDKETSLVVAALDDGRVYLNREQISAERVEERISAALKDRSAENRVVFIKSGSAIQYGTVVSLVAAVRSAGCDRIGLVSEKERLERAAALSPARSN